MSRLIRYMKPYTLPFLVMVVFLLGQTLASLALPDYLATIVNVGIVQQNTDVVYQTGQEMLLVALLGGACMVGVGYLASRIAAAYTRDLRGDVFATIEGFSLVEFNRFSTASLITRSTNDLQQIQMVLVLLLRLALMAPIMGIGAVIKAYDLAPSMTWIMAVAVSILVVIVAALFAAALPRYTRLQNLVDALNLVARERLTGLRVIRAFNREASEEDRFEETNRELTDVTLVVNRLMALMQPVLLLILNLTSVAIVWVGAHRIADGTLQIGDMLAFMQYAMQAIFSFLLISMIFVMVPRAAVSARRVAEVLATEPSIRDPEQPRTAPGRGMVEFRDVTFIYPDAEEPALQHVSFTALPGQTTAFVGPTGSGKSTLVALILRFYDVTAGQVLIDGVDVRDMRQEDLRARIGYVSQRAILFSGTVESNIRYGNEEASSEDTSCAIRRSSSSMTASPRSISAPTPCCARRSPRRPRSGRY
jgi:ATP-binding cassette subfamily B protein